MAATPASEPVARTAGGIPSAEGTSRGGWIWSAPVDLGVFGGSAAASLLLVLVGPRLSPDGALPAWGFFVLVVCIDVAHVWSTLYRTYLDWVELSRRPFLYAGVPLAVFAVGVALHRWSALAFWRALAYVAVFHFVRQQAGWVAIYRARSGERGLLDRALDDAAIYASTLFPLAVWHARLPRAFDWFVEGDFVPLPRLERALPWITAATSIVLAAYAVRSVARAVRGRHTLGKDVVVATTAITWCVGIVLTDSDVQFTAANVIVHGVPYLALLFGYLRERTRHDAPPLLGLVARGGIGAFMGLVVALAFAEELVWDRAVWHARPSLFGVSSDHVLSPAALSILVPLLALPQGTHYVLDAVLWRRKDTGRAQARALGFGSAPRGEA